jgi:subtilisin family serine protease
MSVLLADARELGCAVVCSAGNDATDRPAFPAALWRYPGAEYEVEEPDSAAPHLSVGALNPDNRSVALFSNVGRWVKTYAPGSAVLSTSPAFQGAVQAGTRDDLLIGDRMLPRATIDPDDFTGGFAVWSGTSFAAPWVAGALAHRIAPALMAGTASPDAAGRSRELSDAADGIQKALTLPEPS